jgi:hypothetical protein
MIFDRYRGVVDPEEASREAVPRSWIGTVLSANSKVGTSLSFCHQRFITLVNDGRRIPSLTRHTTLIACLSVEL